MLNGGDTFGSMGTKTSNGTKVFALAGKIKKGGKWIPKEEKNRGVKIAVEAAGMQKRREFIPYS